MAISDRHAIRHSTPVSRLCARVQIKRVAEARNMDEKQVAELVEKSIERPLFGLFGPSKVNVLKLNVVLDQINPGL